MLDVCREHAVCVVVPTIDTELPILAASRDRFSAISTTVAVSGPETIGIGGDKRRTHRWLSEHGYPTVRQAEPEDVLARPAQWAFPLLLKPARGSASVGVRTIHTLDELRLAVRTDGDIVVQTIAPGVEHTVDVFVDGAGRVRCAVPRRRLETRGGEVSKAVTVRSATLEDLASGLVAALPDAFGAFNVQVFLDRNTGSCSIIEVNPRFGGGFPLSWRAGADFPRWLLEEVLGLDSTATANSWESGLVMLRYDDAMFVDAQTAGL
jgi:carbamoyl-phosphate synthase large subunit